MGLDTTHDCWHGGYTAFHFWRVKLAAAVNIPLDLMDGFYSDRDGDLNLRVMGKLAVQESPRLQIIQDKLSEYHALLPIPWEILKPDVLHFLLHHSDCDGDIPAELCAPLADRLQEVLPLLPDENVGGHIGTWRDKTQKFIDGLRLAASRGEAVEFH